MLFIDTKYPLTPAVIFLSYCAGYLPVVFLEALMMILPIVLRFVGKKFIRFKTKSETDKFVFSWHFAYRVANLLIIILKNQVMCVPQQRGFPFAALLLTFNVSP